jgi:hypothetical protein
MEKIMFKKFYFKTIFIVLLSLFTIAAKADNRRNIFTITPSSSSINVGVNNTAQVSFAVKNTFGYALTISSVKATLTNSRISTSITGDTCTNQRIANNVACTITMTLKGISTGTDGLNVQVRETLGRGSQMAVPIIISSTAKSYSIAGSISGLIANGLVLQNNGTDDTTISNSATSFSFANKIAQGGSYNVTVKTQPSGQTCTVNNGNGTDVNKNIANINISCVTTSSCEEVGGIKVSGSSACWVKQVISDPTTILRCSDVCSNVGLVLQEPGPVLNELLAGKVCSVYGYTDAPTQASPGDITFIGQADGFSSTSCVWEDISGTNWNNPNNTDYSGETGNYICPCA